jgi:hypothetical protein
LRRLLRKLETYMLIRIINFGKSIERIVQHSCRSTGAGTNSGTLTPANLIGKFGRIREIDSLMQLLKVLKQECFCIKEDIISLLISVKWIYSGQQAEKR